MNPSRSVVMALMGVLWLLAPAHSAVNVVGSLDRHFHAMPGEVIRGEIEVFNALDEPAWVRVEVTDYAVDHFGQVSYPRDKPHDRSLAHYIQLMSPEQTLQPKTSGRIGFEVMLPTLAERPELKGAYWAVMMVRQQALNNSPVDQTLPAPLNGWVIQQRFQTAVRITTEVAGQIDDGLVFQDPQLRLQPTPRLQVDLMNSGERLLDMHLIGELFNAQGQSLGQVALGRIQIYPGHQRRIEWVLQAGESQAPIDIHEGHYQALIIAEPRRDDGRIPRFGGRFDLRWGGETDSPIDSGD